MSANIRTTTADGVMTLVMDRPDKKNALTDAMYGALADGLEAADRDPATRVIVIRGEGDMFTAGNDLGEFAATGARGGDIGPRNVSRFLRALATARKPLIAAAQGRAVGVGTTMLLHCDVVVLSDDALLTTPFVNLALVPEAASSLLLPARIGHVRAFSMFALGEAVNAQDAVAWGLATRIAPRAELAAVAEDYARRLAAQPLGALIATKALMRPTNDVTVRMDVEGEEFSRRLASPEAAEAFAAFAGRRRPDFTRFA